MMPSIPARKEGLRLRPLSQERRGDDASERTRIRTSMRRWQTMDYPARLLGRGLGMRELVDRVAKEVGTSLRQVHCALKKTRDD
jgi:hypothetical protein